MQTFDSISAATLGIMGFYRDHSDDIPAHLMLRFETLAASPSPVDQIVGVGEFLYANRDQLPAAALDLAGGLISFATNIGQWHGLAGGDNRGNLIVQQLRHEMGELAQGPAQSKIPAAQPGARIDPPGAEPAVEPEEE